MALARDAADSGRTAHSNITITDVGASAAKIWAFRTAADWSVGLLDSYKEQTLPAGTDLTRKNFSWTQDTAGTPSVSRVESRLDPGTSNEKMSAMEQTLDARGNVTQAKKFDYGAGSTPTRTYDDTYVTDTNYTNQEKWNLLRRSFLTAGSQTVQLVENTYDGAPEGFSGGTKCSSEYSGAPPAYTGLLTKQVSPGTVTNYRYSTTGTAVEGNDGNGHESAVCLDGTLTMPGLIKPQGLDALQTTVVYSNALAPNTVTEPNVAVTQITYDGTGRPSTTTSKFGAVTTYTYSNNPAWTMAATNGHWVKTWKDGFGRTIKVEKGDGAPNLPVTKSVQETEYGPCACSPLGKVSRVSNPYAPGDTPVWTTYQYDARGRTTRVTLPDGSATVYAYAGNAVTITDPAGKWKKQVTDAFGNLVQVVEPNPAGGADWVTNQTFDPFDRLVLVSMPRGSVTQTRTWVYDATTQRLASVTEPETGTTSYTWNADGTLLRKTDAKLQKVEFAYDTLKRPASRTPKLANNTTDACAVTEYSYDTNGYEATYSQNAQGRVTAVRHGRNCPNLVGDFVKMYSYHSAGAVTGKKLKNFYNAKTGTFAATYSYDTEGRDSSYSYDTMGRPKAKTGLVAAVDYNAADQPTKITYKVAEPNNAYIERFTYNVLGQVTQQYVHDGSLYPSEQASFDYTYVGGANNGRISQFKDRKTLETVNYTYDALNRLATADAADWGQSFVYDGFGNLTSEQVTKGTAPNYSLTVNGATNRIQNAGYGYDANGNMTSIPNVGTVSYDVLNRAWGGAGRMYRDDNKLLVRTVGTTKEVWFWGPSGQLENVLQWTEQTSSISLGTTLRSYGYFLGRRVEPGRITDRTGTVRAKLGPGGYWLRSAGYSYFPYGQERGTATAQELYKFGTYYREGNGLDYAEARYFASGFGRFVTADPYQASGDAGEPGSWNRYAYVGGDPVNFNDSPGLFSVSVAGQTWEGTDAGACKQWATQLYSNPWLAPQMNLGSAGILASQSACMMAAAAIFAPRPPVAAPPAEGDCFLQVKYRSIDTAPGYNHAYLWVKDRWGNMLAIEGFPERNILYNWGLLTVQNSPSGLKGSDVWNDSQAGRTLVSPGLSATRNSITINNLCDDIDKIFSAENYYSSHQVTYNATGGPNSNSLARWLLLQGNVDQYFSAPPGTSGMGGWDLPIY